MVSDKHHNVYEIKILNGYELFIKQNTPFPEKRGDFGRRIEGRKFDKMPQSLS